MYQLNQFCNIISTLRKERGWTQTALAEKLGIAPQSISKWECGVGYPDVTLFPVIAELFDVPIGVLFGQADPSYQHIVNDTEFKHAEPDRAGDQTISLHDCTVNKIVLNEKTIQFFLPDGLWVTTFHRDNQLDKVVRSDAAVVEFAIDSVSDIMLEVRNRFIFGKTIVKIENIRELADAVNKGECTLEFIYGYRTYFEQMWECAIHSKKKPYYRECQLHLPGARATYYWNDLRSDCSW